MSNMMLTNPADSSRRRFFAGGIAERLVDICITLAGLILVITVATVPLQPRQQALFAVATAVTFLIANRFPQRGVTMFLVMLSLAVSLRYMVWRVTDTLGFASWSEVLLGSTLAVAEVYAILVLVLGFIQSVWPLNRRPVPLPDDMDLWPSVDVYIPTYNESMDIVRATVLGAMAMDWPRDRIKIFLLDDGKREEFRIFADQCGIGYITRQGNAHAKAGNLNNALTVTDSEYIVIFDCDHIPTRAFLQVSMGWMVYDPNLALLQTPHHFYSPDPFQRNLAAGTRVPSEGNMFYGLVQDGNDYWNACFFCGSCAVLRRTALEDIGGFAVETVTEDAHTMLKMHRRGWGSAYLKVPLAAGLATERLALHIGQRIRWARGMLQIFRIDNPLTGRGLSFGQRICYLQATGHFLFAIPRVIFLCSPLAYLLLNQNIIAASPLAIVAYALPHLFHAVATNSRIQKNWRHSFWSEVYETVLALFLVRVTITTLISPGRGKFNVTAKGGLLENGYFDLRAVYPNLFLSLFLVAGVMRGLVSMIFFHNPRLVFQALLLNTVWATLSLLIVMAALAVGRETRQLRSRARVDAVVDVVVYLPDGRVVTGETRDLSQGGASLNVLRPDGVAQGSELTIEFTLGIEPLLVRAAMLRWEGQALQVRFVAETIAEESQIVQAVFGRADAWSGWSAFKDDQPLASLWRVLVSIGGLFRPADRAVEVRSADQGPPDAPAASPTGLRAPARSREVAGIVLFAAALLLPVTLRAQTAPVAGQTLVRPIAEPVAPINPAGQAAGASSSLAPTAAVAPAPSVPALPANNAAGPADTTIGATVNNPAPAMPDIATAAARPNTRVLTLSLKQLGALGPLSLRGTSELQGVQFGIRSDEVVTAAQLHLLGAMSPRLIPQFSNDTVTLNEQYVGTIPVDIEHPSFDITMPISPVFFQDNNRLNFRFTGRYTPICNDPLSGLLWSTIYDTTTLTMTLERLPPQRDLSRLPLPFFDAHEKLQLVLPVIMPDNADNATLKAAGIVASWFGQQADFRGARFPVLSVAPPAGNAIVIVVGNAAPQGVSIPQLNGPTLAEIANPNDAQATLLLVAGRTGDEAITAARTLALTYRALGGPSTTVQEPRVPARSPYDAPYWIPTTRPVRFGELVDASALQNYGYTGMLHVPFRTAPDFFTWRSRSFPEVLKFRTPTGPIIDVAPSRLDVGINGLYLDTFSLAPASRRESWFSRVFGFGVGAAASRTGIPAYDVFGDNDMQFFFDVRPLHRGDCVAIPNDLRQAIDPDSTVDLSSGYRFTRMPNLAYFVSAGFPFTRMADLSRTAVVLPAQPGPIEVSAYLTLMGRIGSITGYPVSNVAIVRPGELDSVADRDIILMGTIPHLQDAASLLADSPMRIDGGVLTIDMKSQQDSFLHLFSQRSGRDLQRAATSLSTAMTPTTAALIGAESPLRGGRSLVAILATEPQGLDGVVATFRDTTKAPSIQGDLSLLSGDQVTSFRVGDTYTVGHLPIWVWPGYYLTGQPLINVVVMVLGCIFLGLALFWAMRRRAQNRVRELYRPD